MIECLKEAKLGLQINQISMNKNSLNPKYQNFILMGDFLGISINSKCEHAGDRPQPGDGHGHTAVPGVRLHGPGRQAPGRPSLPGVFTLYIRGNIYHPCLYLSFLLLFTSHYGVRLVLGSTKTNKGSICVKSSTIAALRMARRLSPCSWMPA